MKTVDPLLKVEGLSKKYDGVRALDQVSLSVSAGEIHGLCGENGAGKSTLIKILSGTVRPDRGQVHWRGEPLPFGSVQSSAQAGIAVMHQESTAFADLNAVDNLFVGSEITRCGGLLLDHVAMRRDARNLFDRLGVEIDIDRPLGQLPLAHRQMVAMARALSKNCRLLIMDEPTASLSTRETDVLLGVIRQLRDDGVSVLYVSHRLEEVFEITDRVSVLRDGQFIASTATNRLTESQLVAQMVGRSLDEGNAPNSVVAEEPAALVVDSLTRQGVFRDVSFAVRPGEILGVAGLVGAGRSEVARAIFGIDRYDSGRVAVQGRPLIRGSVQAAIHAGMALVPEDRQHEGLILPMSIASNLSLVTLRRLTRWGLVQRSAESRQNDGQIQNLDIKSPRASAAAATLSGGNQQKVVLGKWLASQPRVLLLDEPTRGIDVAAKAQFHEHIAKLASDGVAILVISSELPELLSLCHRILVMRQGRVVSDVPRESANQESLLKQALPVSLEAVE